MWRCKYFYNYYWEKSIIGICVLIYNVYCIIGVYDVRLSLKKVVCFVSWKDEIDVFKMFLISEKCNVYFCNNKYGKSSLIGYVIV